MNKIEILAKATKVLDEIVKKQFSSTKKFNDAVKAFLVARAKDGRQENRPCRKLFEAICETTGKMDEDDRAAVIGVYEALIKPHGIKLDTGEWFHIYPSVQSFPAPEIATKPVVAPVTVPVAVVQEAKVNVDKPKYVAGTFSITPVHDGRLFYPTTITRMIAGMKKAGILPSTAKGTVNSRSILISGVDKFEANKLSFAVANRAKMQVYLTAA